MKKVIQAIIIFFRRLFSKKTIESIASAVSSPLSYMPSTNFICDPYAIHKIHHRKVRAIRHGTRERK